MRHSQRLRGEVVDDAQFIQLKLSLQGADGKFPVVVGHLHAITGDGVGDSNRRLFDADILRTQVGSDGVFKARIVGSGQGVDSVQADAVAKGETGVGATDIGE